VILTNRSASAGGGGIRLEQYQANVHSESGEDGMIRRAFQVFPDLQKWCVEFGAWDGRFHSNTHRLIEQEGWRGVLIEADANRYRELERHYARNDKAICVNTMVDFAGKNSLDAILSRTEIPRDFDLLSIDTDGTDWHLWRTLTSYRPKLVVIEFNLSIPNDIDFVQAADHTVHQGSSLAALARLGKQKGYELVAVSEGNAFFVVRELFPLFGIQDNSPAAINTDRSRQTRVFQLFDGTLVWDGCTRLIWQGVDLGQVQAMPKRLRHLPGYEPNLRTRLWRTLYVLLLRALSPVSQGLSGRR
jgi:hypothetical protein